MLLESSQYVLDVGTAATASAAFVSQFGNEFPGLTENLARGAASIAILGGSTEEANKFFTDQLKAISGLSPGIKTYGSTVIDTSRAQDLWNLAAADGEELLDSQKRAILVDVLYEELAAREAVTKGMEPYNTNIKELTKSTMGGWTAIKVFLGSGLSSLIGMFQTFGERTVGATKGMSYFAGEMAKAAAIMLGFGGIVDGVSEILDGGIRGLLLGIVDDLENLTKAIGMPFIVGKLILIDFVTALTSVSSAFQAIGDGLDKLLHGDFSGMKDSFASIPGLLEDAMGEVDFSNISKTIDEAWASQDAVFSQFFDPMRNALGAITEKIANTKWKAPTIDLSAPLDALSVILDGQFELQKNMQEAWDNYNEQITSINSQLTEDLKELQEKRQEDLLAAQEEFTKKSADAQEAYVDKILDINGKLQLKEFRAQEDAEDSREKARRTHNKKIEDIETNHQKKMNEIMRKFDLDRLKALIDRDARALFEAERRRDEDQEKEREAAEKKREDAADDIAQKLADIDAAEKKKLERMREDAEISRRQAREDYSDKLKDLQDATAEEIAEIEAAYVEKRNTARREAFQDKIDARKVWNEAKKKLIDDLKERERLEIAAELQKNLLIIRALQDHGEDVSDEYAAWLQDFEQLKNDHNEIVTQFNYPDPLNLTGLSGSIGDPDPGGGGDSGNGCVSGANIKFTPTQDEGCSQVPVNMLITACDGSKWYCINGKWTARKDGGKGAASMAADQKTVNGLPSGSGSTNLVTDSSGRGGGSNGNQVTIVVEGDKTLEQIFSEIAYTAYIETITP